MADVLLMPYVAAKRVCSEKRLKDWSEDMFTALNMCCAFDDDLSDRDKEEVDRCLRYQIGLIVEQAFVDSKVRMYTKEASVDAE